MLMMSIAVIRPIILFLIACLFIIFFFFLMFVRLIVDFYYMKVEPVSRRRGSLFLFDDRTVVVATAVANLYVAGYGAGLFQHGAAAVAELGGYFQFVNAVFHAGRE